MAHVVASRATGVGDGEPRLGGGQKHRAPRRQIVAVQRRPLQIGDGKRDGFLRDHVVLRVAVAVGARFHGVHQRIEAREEGPERRQSTRQFRVEDRQVRLQCRTPEPVLHAVGVTRDDGGGGRLGPRPRGGGNADEGRSPVPIGRGRKSVVASRPPVPRDGRHQLRRVHGGATAQTHDDVAPFLLETGAGSVDSALLGIGGQIVEGDDAVLPVGERAFQPLRDAHGAQQGVCHQQHPSRAAHEIGHQRPELFRYAGPGLHGRMHLKCERFHGWRPLAHWALRFCDHRANPWREADSTCRVDPISALRLRRHRSSTGRW